MKQEWKRDGIKYDRNAKNDYQDGYNAGRRYWQRHIVPVLITIGIAGMAIGSVVVFATFIVGYQ